MHTKHPFIILHTQLIIIIIIIIISISSFTRVYIGVYPKFADSSTTCSSRSGCERSLQIRGARYIFICSYLSSPPFKKRKKNTLPSPTDLSFSFSVVPPSRVFPSSQKNIRKLSRYVKKRRAYPYRAQKTYFHECTWKGPLRTERFGEIIQNHVIKLCIICVRPAQKGLQLALHVHLIN